ncbi:50S ribosomal protein L4 [Campylobacter pinnipediorum]|uniref:Large ribosomal subunit protein uL4 n=1 Tax=Campylobacter pinnipediorum subsp. pinnipediorum TaxID=1660067 RepID=A0AAX0LC08_9BACT|nr:50S ribosomal protein L4 [Campylobacter pinnipediorum]AQW80487.1 50S ribosomal protein L4 [Campylobacter pinnipediorum subsp. pinnipediorum]AQW82156.1 50S ribosomal protein L4 [Campylobacter pinnipediorum subsp. pinnipediorum]AQW83833.1 50S ribosomal protein L4 [Campylobacter pinnipediorum subsp. pinnipediorum]AQW85352.1 50S ribosomal protein L4 [Campylobacter pinnipediorum subsp. caledonicus]OPA71952.1 50S ribosomal protein L4 [Campylobacter pinnipediorum subsp. caledonicus]
MSKICVLNDKFEKASELELPASYAEVNPHNLYLYVKSYLASMRANTAHTKSRAFVSGGGKKPWRQKGRGGARAGSTRTNVWVGGAVAFGPTNNKNYFQKVNKKQKRLALEVALAQKAEAGKLFAVDSVEVQSGKTKDANKIIKSLNLRDVLVVKDLLDDKTLLAFRNLANSYVVDASEVNAYLVATYSAVIIEKAALQTITKEG